MAIPLDSELWTLESSLLNDAGWTRGYQTQVWLQSEPTQGPNPL